MVFLNTDTQHRTTRLTPFAFLVAVCLVSGQASKSSGVLAVDAEINGPLALAIDRDGNIFSYESATEYEGLRRIRDFPSLVRRIDSRTGTIVTVIKICDPPWREDLPTACVNPIYEMHFSSTGELIIAEISGILRSFNLKTRRFSVLTANANVHSFVPVSGGYVIGGGDHRIRFLDSKTGKLSVIAGNGNRGYSGDGGPAIDAEMDLPISIAADSHGNIFFADGSEPRRIREIEKATGLMKTATAEARPRSLVVDPLDRLSFVTGGEIRRFDPRTSMLETIAGSYMKGHAGDGGPARMALIEPEDLAIDREGNIFLSEYENNRIRRIDAKTGIITTVGGNGLPHREPGPRF